MLLTLIAGRYAVLDKLGEGGMGTVYRARDRLTGQTVALKRVRVLPPSHRPLVSEQLGLAATQQALPQIERTTDLPRGSEWHPEPGASEPRVAFAPTRENDTAPLLALSQEFRTLASIRHPHIIAVLDYGFDTGHSPFFTMEVLEGARPLLQAAAGLNQAQRVRLLLQILAALTYVHRRGILHREICKPNFV